MSGVFRVRVRGSTRDKGAHLTTQPPVSAREWGRRKAAESPRWSADKWDRVALILGLALADEPDQADSRSSASGRDAA
ncbi:hypothetical protein GCM10010116_38550 [Microbispora rosea subsp. aerata]|nr:hypothetical protein GCM10010116_38550 [Microbispora rosea subsp. aerata]GIH54463.1 hypothetical protein Mro02_13770 [Microbispora rosea subsp. aerata]GLJ81436.1 hypothetical protein GCM10017588_01590 [Microbispora rosea subsp. aerata]